MKTITWKEICSSEVVDIFFNERLFELLHNNGYIWGGSETDLYREERELKNLRSNIAYLCILPAAKKVYLDSVTYTGKDHLYTFVEYCPNCNEELKTIKHLSGYDPYCPKCLK